MALSGQTEAIAKVLGALPSELPKDHRFVIALAGPPAAGKTTLAAALVDALDNTAGLLAMDGFHFDDSILASRGHLPRKGAPHTFDVASYAMTLRTVRDSPGIEQSVPVFDRDLELSRNCASLVSSSHRILVTEGNYLLLRDAPWEPLRELFDLTVWLNVPLETIEKRTYERWSSAGFPAEEIRRRAEENDLPNARAIIGNSGPADLTVF